MTLDLRLIPPLLAFAALSATVACGTQDGADPPTGAVDDGPGDTEPGNPPPGDTEPGNPPPGDTEHSDTDAATDTATDSGGIDPDPTGPGPCFESMAPDEPAFALDFGDWVPAVDIEGQGGWSGPCTVAAVQQEDAWETTLDCSADPAGPPQIVASFSGNEGEAAWAVDDVLDIVYVRDDWADGERLIARSSADAALFFALVDGGGDGGLPLHDEELAPISVTYDLDFCGGDPSPAPVLVDFAEPGGTVYSVMHDSDFLLELDDGQSFRIYLREAIAGDLSNHYGAFVDVVIHRS